MTKTCPRCQTTFECKTTDIQQCQCYGVHLTSKAVKTLEKYTQSCLCRACLIDMNEQVSR